MFFTYSSVSHYLGILLSQTTQCCHYIPIPQHCDHQFFIVIIFYINFNHLIYSLSLDILDLIIMFYRSLVVVFCCLRSTFVGSRSLVSVTISYNVLHKGTRMLQFVIILYNVIHKGTRMLLFVIILYNVIHKGTRMLLFVIIAYNVLHKSICHPFVQWHS